MTPFGVGAGALGFGILGGVTGWNQPIKGGGNISLNRGVSISPQTKEFLALLAQRTDQAWQITSGIRGGNPGNLRSHASGNKVDIGLSGKTDAQILALMRSLSATPGFQEGGLELGHSRYSRLINQFQRQGGDPSKFKDFTSSRTTGPHIDVLRAPITIHVNGVGDPKATAKEVATEIKTALSTHNLQGWARA